MVFLRLRWQLRKTYCQRQCGVGLFSPLISFASVHPDKMSGI